MKETVKRQFDRRDFVKSIGSLGAAAAGMSTASSLVTTWR